MSVEYRTVEVEGLNIFYREAGPKAAPTILLLHGFPSSSHMFRDLIPQLAADFHIVAPDYPGFGYSDAPTPGEFTYTFDHLAEVIEKFLQKIRLTEFSLYMQDYGGPVGFRLATAKPERVQALIVQNANAYTEGISAAFEPLKPFWAKRTAETEKPARALLQRETTIFQYTHGASRAELISPDAWTLDQALLDRPGNDAIQLELLHNYTSNVALYPQWQDYLRRHQPPTLIVSGKNDPFFIPPGQEAFKRDLKDVKIHLLDAGHFALEDHADEIASHIKQFLGATLSLRKAA